MKRILFLAPHPPTVSASQRFRFEHYLNQLQLQGFAYDYEGFLDIATWKIFFQPGYLFKKVRGVMSGFFKRTLLMLKLRRYDVVFIHREAAPMGPPVFEWWICKIARKKIIYDFDDAIWFNVASSSNPYAGFIKWPQKVRQICRYSWKVSVGNQFLANFAAQYNSNVVIVPTVVDTENIHNKIKSHQPAKLTIGWTGTFTNFHYLQAVLPVINLLKKTIDFNFLIIADLDPQFIGCDYRFLPWNKQSEIDDLLRFDIGLMPLIDSGPARGKCAFKAIQYMSLGIPAVVSNVGANSDVVDSGVNGYLCNNEDEWYHSLLQLLSNDILRATMGAKARKKIVDNYSVVATTPLFISLFK